VAGIPATLADGLAAGGGPARVFGRDSRPGGAPQVLDLPLDGAADAEVRIAFGAGRLLVGPAASGRLVDGTFEGGVDATPAGPGRVRLATPHSGPWSWSWGRPPFAWRIGLTAEVPLRLELETGASDNELDLGSLRVTDLRLRTGAAQSRVTLPAIGVTRVTPRARRPAAVPVPGGRGGADHERHGDRTTDVDTARFPRTPDGSAWASPDFGSNPNRVEIAVRGRVGQVTGRLIRGRRRGQRVSRRPVARAPTRARSARSRDRGHRRAGQPD